jgi:uncharacterized membrane-anchored protein YhcB (DUF1043 family)
VNLLSFDEIWRVYLIAWVALMGVIIGYYMVRLGVDYCVKKENECIKELEESLRVLERVS